MITLIYAMKQFKPNSKFDLYLPSIEMLLNTFPLALKIETFSFKFFLKILNFFVWLNNKKFGVVDFVQTGDLICYNYKQSVKKIKHKDTVLQLYTEVSIKHFWISIGNEKVVFTYV